MNGVKSNRSEMRNWIVWIIAALNTITMLMVWLAGYFNHWTSIIHWNKIGEGYFEGVALGLMVIFLAVVYVNMLKGKG